MTVNGTKTLSAQTSFLALNRLSKRPRTGKRASKLPSRRDGVRTYSGTSLTVSGMSAGSRKRQTKKLKSTHIDAKVLKVKFSNGDNQQHSYVDPWLLLLKNAVMFSEMMGRKLLPGCNFEASNEVSDSTTNGENERGSTPGIPETICFSVGGAK